MDERCCERGARYHCVVVGHCGLKSPKAGRQVQGGARVGDGKGREGGETVDEGKRKESAVGSVPVQ